MPEKVKQNKDENFEALWARVQQTPTFIEAARKANAAAMLQVRKAYLAGLAAKDE